MSLRPCMSSPSSICGARSSRTCGLGGGIAGKWSEWVGGWAREGERQLYLYE